MEEMDVDKSKILRNLIESAKTRGDSAAVKNYQDKLAEAMKESNRIKKQPVDVNVTIMNPKSMVRKDPWSSPTKPPDSSTKIQKEILETENEEEETANEQERAAEEEEITAKEQERAAEEEEITAKEQEKATEEGEVLTKKEEKLAKIRIKGEKLEQKHKRKGGKIQAIKEKIKNNIFVQTGHLGVSLIQGIIKYVILILIIGGIFFFVWLSLYGQYAQMCVEYRAEDKIGTASLWDDLWNWGFVRCIASHTSQPLKDIFRKLSITDQILSFMDQQVYRATGDYYFTEVDKNSKEPVGVFIEKIDKEQTYYTDEIISADAEISVKTIGNIVEGNVGCKIDEKPASTLHPNDGTFSVDKSSEFPIGCIFDKNRLDSGIKSLTFTMQYNFNTFAYIVPTFIKQSVYQKLNPSQKEKLENNAGKRIFMTTNAPVKIGGVVGGGEDRLVIINDLAENSDEEKIDNIKLGITLQATSWDDGKIHKVEDLAIILPDAFRITREGETEDKIIACGGYTFNFGKCSDLNGFLNEKIEDEELNICNDNDVVYALDSSGDNEKIRDISDFTTVRCWMESEVGKIFSDESEEVGLNSFGIKIYTSYMYENTRSVSINIIKRDRDATEITPRRCSESVLEKLDSKEDLLADRSIEGDIIRKYIRRAEEDIRASKNKKYLDSGIEDVEMEALVVAISEKFSDEFNLEVEKGDSNDDGIIDFLTGCQKQGSTYQVYMDKPKEDVICLANELNKVLKETKLAIPATLESYYRQEEDVSQYKEIYDNENKRTNEDNYYLWLSYLCGRKKVNPEEDTDELRVPEEPAEDPIVADDRNNEETSEDPSTAEQPTTCENDNDCPDGTCDIDGSKTCIAA